MISTLCYALVFLVESLISFYYLDFKYERKIPLKYIIIFLTLSFSVQFAINTLSIPAGNAIAFFLCNFALAKCCYQSSLKSAIFSSSILLFFMIVTELIVVYFSTFFYDTSFFESYDNSVVLMNQAIICKLLYFISVHLTVKLSTKEESRENNKYTLFLTILPIASIIVIHTTLYLCSTYAVKSGLIITLSIGNILLLLSNIVVFYINELSIKISRENTQILLENQREERDKEYYTLLKQQNDNSKVLIHDITKHLNTIKQLSQDSNSDIEEYVNSIVDDFEVLNPVEYCNNPVVNLITNRYYSICKSKGITFVINVCGADLDIMKDYETTALLDNLLENAVEATSISTEKFIDFSIITRNTNFTMIKIVNSSDNKPKINKGILLTNKPDNKAHGIGTRSIKRVVEKYNGNYEIKYDEEKKTFTTLIGIER